MWNCVTVSWLLDILDTQYHTMVLIHTQSGVQTGTVYIQTTNPTFILSGYGVFSCASGLFMFPIVYTYLYRALEVRVCPQGLCT